LNRSIALLVCLGAASSAVARVHTIRPAQSLTPPDASYGSFGTATAIDGGSIIVLADHSGRGEALLYRRNGSGQWKFSRSLSNAVAPGASVAMKNSIAAVQLIDTLAIFEFIAGDWVRATLAAPAQHPGGIAISGRRVLVGGNRCDDEAVAYEKGADGIWAISGRIDGAETCDNNGVAIELNYDNALVRMAGNEVRAYHAAAGSWPQTTSFQIPAVAGTTFTPMALQKSTAVSPGSAVFHRSGSEWSYTGQLQPLDYGNGTGHAGKVKYRDGVLLTTEGDDEIHQYTKVYAYHENADGSFSHVGILETSGWTDNYDVSGNTVVVSAEDENFEQAVATFTLPSPLVPPAAIANDFNAHDISGFQQTAGSGYALAGNVSNYLYRQSATTGESIAVLTGSDWTTYYQSIEADITPTAFDGADRYVGLAVRYLDAGNNYYVTWRSSNVIQLKRKVNGAYVTLAETSLPLALNVRHHLRLSIFNSFLEVYVDDFQALTAIDTTFPHGRAALLTYRARADFDNVYASPTRPINLNYNDWVFYWYGYGRPFTEIGGTWYITGQNEPEGLSQTTTTGLALAVNGVATDDQEITAHIRLDSFATPSGAWFGLLARYLDERNYYYLTVRSSNVLQIRKLVNGVTTVLKSVSFTAAPGVMREYTLSVRGSELHAFVDGQLVATALDNALPRGKYGMGTNRAAATWQDFDVTQ